MGKTVDVMNWHRLEELYEIDTPQQITKPFSYVVNQIIHSFTFMFSFETKSKIHGTLFNSDRSKKDVIYQLKLQDLINVLSPIANCYIGKATYFRFNENDGMTLLDSKEIKALKIES